MQSCSQTIGEGTQSCACTKERAKKSATKVVCSHLGVHGVCFGSPLQTGGVKGHGTSLATLQHLGMFIQYLLPVEREGVNSNLIGHTFMMLKLIHP